MTAPLQSVSSQYSRVYAFDYVRCFSLLLVILFHVVIGLDRSGDVVVPHWLITVNESLRSVRMPAFFFVSGYLFHMVFESGRSRFWRSLILGLIIPYLVWSELYIGIRMAFADQVARPVDAWSALHILWEPVDHFWFIYVLVFIRLTFFGDYRVFSGALLPVLIGTSLILYYCANAGIQMPDLLVSFTRGALYFGVGLLLARRGPSRLNFNSSPRLLSGIGLGVLLFLVSKLLRFWFIDAEMPWLAALLQVVIEPAIGISALLALFSILPPPRGWVGKAAIAISTASLAIYLLHPIVAAMVRIVLVKLGVDSVAVHLPTSFVVAALAPLAIYLVADRLRLLPYVALGANRKRRVEAGAAKTGASVNGAVDVQGVTQR